MHCLKGQFREFFDSMAKFEIRAQHSEQFYPQVTPLLLIIKWLLLGTFAHPSPRSHCHVLQIHATTTPTRCSLLNLNRINLKFYIFARSYSATFQRNFNFTAFSWNIRSEFAILFLGLKCIFTIIHLFYSCFMLYFLFFILPQNYLTFLTIFNFYPVFCWKMSDCCHPSTWGGKEGWCVSYLYQTVGFMSASTLYLRQVMGSGRNSILYLRQVMGS